MPISAIFEDVAPARERESVPLCRDYAHFPGYDMNSFMLYFRFILEFCLIFLVEGAIMWICLFEEKIVLLSFSNLICVKFGRTLFMVMLTLLCIFWGGVFLCTI